MRRLSLRFALLIFVIVSSVDRLQTNIAQASRSNPKFLDYPNANVNFTQGDYLILFDSHVVAEASVSDLALSLLAGTDGRIRYIFTKSIRGFAATNLTDAWATTISIRPEVRFIRKDFEIYGMGIRGPHESMPWNLDRIDQRSSVRLDRDYAVKTAPSGPGAPVPIYILDNGIYQDHFEFKSSTTRVENVADVMNTNFARCDLDVPNAGHGTASASVAAGTFYGVTQTIIKNVKVLDRHPFGTGCIYGTPSTVLMGLEETLKDMIQNDIRQAVVNLSIGWSYETPDVALAIANLQQQGAVIIAAAGNENQDVANSVPANLPDVLAVGATDIDDSRTELSNFGSQVDIWAPGSSIKSATWTVNNSTSATDFSTGTSVAAPHVSGAVALLWQQNPTMTPNEIMALLLSRATRDRLSDLGPGSNNLLLFIGEDVPTLQTIHQLSRSEETNGRLSDVQVSYDATQVYVTGGDLSDNFPTSAPYAYAAYDMANLATGPLWQADQIISPAIPGCVDIDTSSDNNVVFFGCMGTHNNAREAMVIATRHDGSLLWSQPAWLGPGSRMNGITSGQFGPQIRVFVLASRPKPPPALDQEIFITVLDGSNGSVLSSVVLSAPGFAAEYQQGVDLVLVEVEPEVSVTFELVVAMLSDPPGADHTFLWRLSAQNLNILDWREVPPPAHAINGMFATALAIQRPVLIGAYNRLPTEIYLATHVLVSIDGNRELQAYVYRLNPDWVTGSEIEIIRNGHISSLRATDGDLYFAGMTTRPVAPGSLDSYDIFLGKHEGVPNSRRWILTYNHTDTQPDSGYGGYSAGRGYIVGQNWNSYYVVEYAIN